MGLKEMFSTMKKEGIVTAPLEKYLYLRANSPDNNRAVNVNSPSQAGCCNRSNYYKRMGFESDGSVDARTQRIFDNGTHVHLRLQKYLTDMGMLVLDEVPLLNDDYCIQGHTDGFIDIGNGEIAILEIKSINDSSFQALKGAKEEHKRQGLVYLYCAECRRMELHAKYGKDIEAFNKSYDDRYRYYEKHYQHLQGGKKYTRSAKIENEVTLNLLSDNILFYTDKPVTKVVFLYENKNNQELKEFVVSLSPETSPLLESVLKDYEVLNTCIANEELPEREGKSKSDNMCRWCNYRNECWVV